MDKRSREIIQKYKSFLVETVFLDKIKRWVKEYKIFTKAMFDDVLGPNCQRDFYDELCTRGPNAFSNFIKVLEKAGYVELAETLRKEIDDRQHPIYYKMDSEPLGYCLIIINEIFDWPLKHRYGCEADAPALENLFKNLKFDVQIEWNKRAREMKNILEKFSKKSEFRNVDCCIVYILSHGDQNENLDFIYGTDGEIVYKKEIYAFFNNDNCQLLADKPKVLFFQACRGKLLDHRRIVKSCKSELYDNACKNIKMQDSQDNASFDAPCPKFDKDLVGVTNLQADVAKPTYSIFSELFIVHSSLPDYKSWRDNCTGSWLAQDLVSVISEYFDEYDLATMITMVCYKQLNRESVDGYKQVIHLEERGVTGLLHFNRKKGVSSSNNHS